MMMRDAASVAGMAMMMLALSSLLLAVSARPNQDLLFDDVRRPVYRGHQRIRDGKSEVTEVEVVKDVNVVSDDRTMGRATVATPTLGEALQMVTRQLLQDPTATDMVATDVRTPPRVKNRLENENIAIVETPDSSTTRAVAKVTTSGGLSTWILLSNGEQSTTVPYKKKPAPVNQSQAKKAQNTPRPTAIIEKLIKKSNETKVEKLSASVASPLTATKKPDRSTTKQPLYDSKFKTKTPVVVGKIPAQKNKTDSLNKMVPTTQTPATYIDVVTKKKLTGSKHTVFIPEAIPTTSLLLESSTLEAPEAPTSTTTSSTTTKRTRRPSTKTKKKKNKVRTRPTKQPSTLDKIDTEVAQTKIENFNRPLSTRIYNYLAREVMPNVGVGLVGLVLTAGLAGLLLYPFGGVVTRRNYEKVAPTPEIHKFYYDSYSPHAGEISNVNTEDNSYGLPSNQQNSYSAPIYDNQDYSNHYRYEVQDYANDNVNGYAGVKDYSTLPDSLKSNQYSTLPENSNYYNMDHMVPLNPQYKGIEEPMTKYDSKYSPVEYSAYTSASAIGTSGTYDKSGTNYDKANLNDKTPVISFDSPTDYERNEPVYDKAASYRANSNKNKTSKADNGVLQRADSTVEQPQYSALSSEPNYGNSEFVGTVSVSGSYGAELGHMTGMLPSTDLGPRNIKLHRRKRELDDFTNEVDSDDKVVKEAPLPKHETNGVETTPTPGTDDRKQNTSSGFDENPMSNEIFPEERTEETTPGSENDAASEGTLPGADEDFSFITVLSRILQLKLKVGISFIRTTSEAFQRYLAGLTRRMETAVQLLDENSQSPSKVNETH